MHDNVQNYLNKFYENLNVCQYSYLGGHYNASASRYYYALRLMVNAYFKKKGIEGERVPDSSGIMREKWRHGDLIDKVHEYLRDEIPDIADLLLDAKEIREKGDYDGVPVRKNQLNSVRKRCKKVIKVMFREIKD